MTAYGGVPAQFPTVFDAGSPPYGPLHRNSTVVFLLGYNLTSELEADRGPDADGVSNISPLYNRADQDEGDDGLLLPVFFGHCRPVTLTYHISVLAPLPGPVYLNVWADWNRNGSWGDTPSCNGQPAPEWAVMNQVLTLTGPGVYTMRTPVFLPYNNAPDQPLWLRISISEQRAVRADGSGPPAGWQWGETEDYLIPGYSQTFVPSMLRRYR